MKWYWSVVIIGLSGSFLQGYIYEIKVLRKLHPETKGYTTVIGLSDFHDKFDETNAAQRAQLIHYISQADKQKLKIIVEDLSSANSCGTCGWNQYILASTQGLLAGLSEQCKSQGCVTDNIEYRYCRVISLGGLLLQVHESPYNYQPACAITVSSLIQEVEDMVQRVKSFNDGSAINDWYKKCSDLASSKLDTLYLHTHASLSSAAYVHKGASKNDRLAFLKELLTFDSALVDCALVHSVVQAKDQSCVLIIAGGTHIKNAFDQLQKFGYQPSYASTISYSREYDLSKALGSPIMNGGYAVKPKPIAIDIVKNYLP